MTSIGTVSSEFAEPMRKLMTFLDTAPESIAVGGHQFTLARRANLAETQLGYSVTADGEILIGAGEGESKPSWIVICWDEDLGDPLFVDLANDALPVFTAEHGRG